MEEMTIQFDFDDVQHALTPIEENYQEFLIISDSFLGWLLTLNLEEFDYVYKNMTHDFVNKPNEGVGFLFTQIELMHQGNSIILRTELESDTQKKVQMTRTIRSVKEGLLEYIPGETDMLWQFSVTEKGMKLVAKAEKLVEIELENRRKNGGERETENENRTDSPVVRDDGTGE